MSNPAKSDPNILFDEFVENANPTGKSGCGVTEVVRPLLIGDFIESSHSHAIEREFTFHMHDNRVVTVVGRDLKYLVDESQPDSEIYAVLTGSLGQDVTVARFAVKEVAGISTGEIRPVVN
jgi:hypothetical protein